MVVILSKAKNLGIDGRMFRLSAQHDKTLQYMCDEAMDRSSRISYDKVMYLHGHDNLWLDWMVDRKQIRRIFHCLLLRHNRLYHWNLHRLADRPRLLELKLR
jgi:hypothetical protein